MSPFLFCVFAGSVLMPGRKEQGEASPGLGGQQVSNGGDAPQKAVESEG